MNNEKIQITMLNSMAHGDFEKSLDIQKSWGIKLLDLKDSILEKNLASLSMEEANCVYELTQTKGMEIYCLSTTFFDEDLESGEKIFRKNHLEKLKNIIDIANIMKPYFIRLLSPWSSKRSTFKNSVDHIKNNHPWLYPIFREAIDMINDAGYHAAIENEVHNNIFSEPEEITEFFSELDRQNKVCLTWDVQNLWHSGTFPTLDVYQKLRHLTGYYHIKGGMHDDNSNELCWASSLEDAAWHVIEITQQVINDGIIKVICLNPSHGKAKPGYDYNDITKRDLDYLRKNFPEVE